MSILRIIPVILIVSACTISKKEGELSLQPTGVDLNEDAFTKVIECGAGKNERFETFVGANVEKFQVTGGYETNFIAAILSDKSLTVAERKEFYTLYTQCVSDVKKKQNLS